MSYLSCQALDAGIGGKPVVRALDFALEGGEFWGLLGANGVGKTTLLRHFSGLLVPEAGKIMMDQKQLSDWPRKLLARRLGMLQQHTAYVFDASVLQVALTGRHPYLGPWQREGPQDLEQARKAISRVGLEELAERSVTSLSGGEARRLAFAALLVQSPSVLLLDEPTNHLDFRHQVRIMRMVGDLVYQKDRVALAALHDVNLAATYCSHVLMLFGDGRWRAGTAADLLTAENLEALYRCPVSAVDTPDGMRFHPSFSALSD
jgi:iron complex transport system ATP-binding protein